MVDANNDSDFEQTEYNAIDCNEEDDYDLEDDDKYGED